MTETVRKGSGGVLPDGTTNHSPIDFDVPNEPTAAEKTSGQQRLDEWIWTGDEATTEAIRLIEQAAAAVALARFLNAIADTAKLDDETRAAFLRKMGV